MIYSDLINADVGIEVQFYKFNKSMHNSNTSIWHLFHRYVLTMCGNYIT